MATPTTLNRILAMLCLLAIPCAHLFGVNKVFVCDCSGSPVAMLQDRCFGVNGEDCHTHEQDQSTRESEDDSHKHAEDHGSFRTGFFSLKPLALPDPVLLDALRLEIPPHRTAVPEQFRLSLEISGSPPPSQWPGSHCILLI